MIDVAVEFDDDDSKTSPDSSANSVCESSVAEATDSVIVSEFDTTSEKSILEIHGLFVVADSLITTDDGRGGIRPVLSGLRKVHSVQINLWRPYIVNGSFRDYRILHQATKCFLAFSGSTLTASHALDVISEHLSNLRISYEHLGQLEKPWGFAIKRDCERIHVRSTVNFHWEEDMFSDPDLHKLLTAEYVADVIEHSINIALKSARKYRLDENAYKSMHTDFMAGIQCQATGTYRLFTFRMNSRTDANGLIEPYTIRQEIGDNKVAVLGLRRFETRAQAVYDAALAAGVSPGEKLFSFINEAIDEVRQSNIVDIDRPSVHKQFRNSALKIAQHRKADNY